MPETVIVAPVLEPHNMPRLTEEKMEESNIGFRPSPKRWWLIATLVADLPLNSSPRASQQAVKGFCLAGVPGNPTRSMRR